MRAEIQKCVEVLRKGGSILYPTDTIWGIGCDATDPEAVAKVCDIKKRVDSKAMLVLVDSVDMIYDYVEDVPEMALEILKIQNNQGHRGSSAKAGSVSRDYGTGYEGQPLTIIYPGATGLANNLISNDGSIGIRITSETFSKELIRAFGKPLVSSSANIGGQDAPANFSEISDEIRSSVDLVAAWKHDDLKKSKPSGILKVSLNGEVKVIRQ